MIFLDHTNSIHVFKFQLRQFTYYASFLLAPGKYDAEALNLPIKKKPIEILSICNTTN